jgi:hypothetical protein
VFDALDEVKQKAENKKLKNEAKKEPIEGASEDGVWGNVDISNSYD